MNGKRCSWSRWRTSKSWLTQVQKASACSKAGMRLEESSGRGALSSSRSNPRSKILRAISDLEAARTPARS